MYSDFSHRQKGVSLIEALIALIVISVGALSIAKLHSNLVASSGLSKTRSEAVNLAQTISEQLRNRTASLAQCNSISSGSQTVTGTNTSFNVAWTVTNVQTPNPVAYQYKRVVTTVTWIDAKGNTQTVSQATQIACTDPNKIAEALANKQEDYLKPTGKARMGGGQVFATLPTTATPNRIMPANLNDGTYTYYNASTGEYLLLDATGKVLMTMKGSSCPPDNPTCTTKGFSTISGRIFIDGNSPTPANIDVRTSDAAYCVKILNSGGLFILNSNYKYFHYQCYVGEGWYGNVGLIRLDNANPNDRVCVGDPNVSPSSAIDSRHPALSHTRSYRGYAQQGSKYVASGIGVAVNGTAPNQTLGEYTKVNFQNHDFLLKSLTGNPSDSSCQAPMNLAGSPFTGNPGKLVCFTGATCPSTSGPAPSATTTIIGTISRNKSGNNYPVIFSISIEGGTCQITSTSNQSYGYSCTINWAGWIGTDWNADMTLNLNPGLLCSTGANGPGIVNATGLTITFLNQSIPTTSNTITQNLTIRHPNASCP